MSLFRSYFFVSGLGELIVGGVLVYREAGPLFWFGVSVLVGGLFSVGCAIWAIDNSVAKATQDSIDDADPPTHAPPDIPATLEPASRTLESESSRRVVPLSRG